MAEKRQSMTFDMFVMFAHYFGETPWEHNILFMPNKTNKEYYSTEDQLSTQCKGALISESVKAFESFVLS